MALPRCKSLAKSSASPIPPTLKRLGIQGSVVLCKSSGVDSFIAEFYLKRLKAEYLSVYFNLCTKYTRKEVTTIQYKLNGVDKIDDRLAWLGECEKGSNAFIPQRNLLLASVASIKYAHNVLIAGISGDEVEDKNPEFFNEVSDVLSGISRYKIRVFSPFWNLDKIELVKWYIDAGGSIEQLKETVSCYSFKERGCCNKCPSCFRRFIALRANGIAIDFYDRKLALSYYRRCLAGKYAKKRRIGTISVLRDYYQGDKRFL